MNGSLRHFYGKFYDYPPLWSLTLTVLGGKYQRTFLKENDERL